MESLESLLYDGVNHYIKIPGTDLQNGARVTSLLVLWFFTENKSKRKQSLSDMVYIHQWY